MLEKLGEPRSVMLVDDNRVALILSRKIIEKARVFKEITSFQSPSKALRHLCEAEQGKHLFPDLILLDIQMPELDGFEFLTEFKKFPPQYQSFCSIFVLTSSYDDTDLGKIREMGNVNQLLEKPLTLETFISLINELYPAYDYPMRNYRSVR